MTPLRTFFTALLVAASAAPAFAVPSPGLDRTVPDSRMALAGLRDAPPFYPLASPCKGRFEERDLVRRASGIAANLNCR